MRASFRLVLPFAAAALVVLLAPPAAPATPPAPTLSALWEEPQDLAARDLYFGPWGQSHAPDPRAVYRFVRLKEGGINPGVVVRDPLGREWHVKQSASDNTHGAEGPVEVVLSRILSAVGYHQPPVYFLPSFLMSRAGRSRTEAGGRFRLSIHELKAHGDWKWMDNPFADTRPMRGLLVILLIFNSSDLKNSNNTLYDVRDGDAVTAQWFVVRDLGTALGDTGRLAPTRSNPALLAKQPLIADVRDGFVRFHYHGLHQELFDRRITIDDVEWAGTLLSRLTDAQWHNAFRAGGYAPDVIDQFLAVVRARVAEASGIRRASTTIMRSRP